MSASNSSSSSLSGFQYEAWRNRSNDAGLRAQRLRMYVDDPNPPLPFINTVNLDSKMSHIERCLAEVQGFDAGLKYTKALRTAGHVTEKDFLAHVLAEFDDTIGAPDGGESASGRLCPAELGLEDFCDLEDFNLGQEDVQEPSPSRVPQEIAAEQPPVSDPVQQLSQTGRGSTKNEKPEEDLHDLLWQNSTRLDDFPACGSVLPSITMSKPAEYRDPDIQPPHANLDPQPASSLQTMAHDGAPRLGRKAIERAVSALFRVEERSKKDFIRFRDIVKRSQSADMIHRMESIFPDAEAWLTRGKDAWEAILKRDRVDSLPDILAFTSLSYVISKLFVEKGQMENLQVLSDLFLFKESIRDAEDRKFFVTFVVESDMWDVGFTHRHNMTLEPRDWGKTDTLDCLLQEKAYGMACESGESIGFAQFNVLSDATLNGAVGGPVSSGEGESACVDPRKLNGGYTTSLYGPLQPIQGIDLWGLPSSCSPSLTPYLPAPSPGLDRRKLRRFEISVKVWKDPEIDLMNTVMFMAVLDFLHDHSEFFFALSGRGRSIARFRAGCEPAAAARSKAERILRQEFFGPLERRGKAAARGLDPEMGALLSMAKSFVVGGKFQTRADVVDYLQAVSTVRDLTRIVPPHSVAPSPTTLAHAELVQHS